MTIKLYNFSFHYTVPLRQAACGAATAGAARALPEPEPAAGAPEQPGLRHPHGGQVAPGLLQPRLPAYRQGLLLLLGLLPGYSNLTQKRHVALIE
jgi:hypothetical protein